MPEETDRDDEAVGGDATGTTHAPRTTTTTTTLAPVEVTRETGVLDGYGGDRLPRVSFISDSPLFGRVAAGDAVLTAGGSDSLAPPEHPDRSRRQCHLRRSASKGSSSRSTSTPTSTGSTS